MDLEKALEGFWDASPEHFDSKIFSPLHSQMHSELGSTYMNNYGMVNSGNEHNGMQNQYGTNGMDFLETFMVESDQFSYDDSGYKDGSVAQILIPEVHVKDHEYSSESDGEVIQVQVYYTLLLMTWSIWVVFTSKGSNKMELSKRFFQCI